MWADLKIRLASLFRRAAMESEMADELRAHVEQETEKLVKTGLPRDEARRQALAAFGGVELVKERSRDARGTRWIEEAWHDVRHGVRLLAKQKRFTAALVLTMALGIGANTAVTGAIDEILWRPLTVPNSDRIVGVFGFDKTLSRYQSISLPDIRDFERASSVQAFAGYSRRPMRVTIGGQARTVSSEYVTASYFRVLAAPFVLGRPFSTEDEAASSPVAVISERFWREHFGAAADVIGQTIRIEAHSVPIVGVASRQLRGDHNLNWYTPADVWIPASAAQALFGGRWTALLQDRAMPGAIFNGLGLLAPGVAVASAEAELSRMFASARPATAAAKQALRVFPAAESKFYPGYRAGFSRNLSAFGFATMLILLLAAANVANLLVERTWRRQREIAIRTALGAGRGRLIRQLFVEGLVLAAPGLVMSLLVAAALQRVLTAFPSALGVELSMDLGITSRVLVYCSAVSLLVAAAVSIMPAMRAAREGVGPLLKRAAAGPRRRSWVSQSLTVLQVGLSAVLLVGSLVIVRGLWIAHTAPLGFDPSRAVVLYVDRFSAGRDRTGPAPLPPGALDRGAWPPPGVTHVALANDEPFYGPPYPTSIQDPARGAAPVSVFPHFVSGSFFETLQIPLLSGRVFDGNDAIAGQTVIINDALARRLWGTESALGRVVTISAKSFTVIGVVGDTRYNDVWNSGELHLYRPIGADSEEVRTIFVRSQERADLMLPAIVRAWNGLAPTVPVEEAMTGAALKARALEPMRLTGALIGAFALVAIGIAGVGLYSTIAWLVEQRSHEIAVRIAIGGLPRRIGGRVMAKAVALTVAGSAIGFAIAVKLVPWLSGFTHGMASQDLWVMTTSAVVLVGVSILAAAVPTRRAVRIDPIVILKSE